MNNLLILVRCYAKVAQNPWFQGATPPKADLRVDCIPASGQLGSIDLGKRHKGLLRVSFASSTWNAASMGWARSGRVLGGRSGRRWCAS